MVRGGRGVEGRSGERGSVGRGGQWVEEDEEKRVRTEVIEGDIG